MLMATAKSIITTTEELLDTIKYNNHHQNKKNKSKNSGNAMSIYYTSYFTLQRTQKIFNWLRLKAL